MHFLAPLNRRNIAALQKLLCFVFLLFGQKLCAYQYTTQYDTVPDLNHEDYILIGRTHNREVRINGKIEYAKINYEEKDLPKLEYFRIDDSTYFCYEYYPDNTFKETGNYRVTNKVAGQDTSQCEDPINPGNFFLRVTVYRQVVKTGYWQEFDPPAMFGSYWHGNYANGKRTGVWKRQTLAFTYDLVEEAINYDTDSTKKYSETNLVLQLPADSIAKRLNGRWSMGRRSCKDSGRRMLYYRCYTYQGNYGGDCSPGDDNDVDYFEFSRKGKFIHQSNYCHFKEEGTWKMQREGEVTVLLISLAGATEPLTFRVVYMDREGRMVTERI